MAIGWGRLLAELCRLFSIVYVNDECMSCRLPSIVVVPVFRMCSLPSSLPVMDSLPYGSDRPLPGTGSRSQVYFERLLKGRIPFGRGWTHVGWESLYATDHAGSGMPPRRATNERKRVVLLRV